MISGSCLCGAVRYEITGALGVPTHCHCSQCRKAHGAAFGTYARVRWTDFVVVSGEKEIASYNSSHDIRRTFCRQCGSTLQFIRESRPESFSLALGTVDSDLRLPPAYHIFVGSKATWYEIADGLPQHEERKPPPP